MTKNPSSDTKQRLFDAAIKVFAQKGYDGATVRAICDRAGANVAAVNYHYGDKENLYAQVLEYIFASPRAEFAPRRKDMTGAPAEDRLREFIENFYNEIYHCGDASGKGCAGHSDLAAIYLMEMANPSPKLDEIVEKYIRPDAEELDAILREIMGEDVPDAVRGYCTGALVAQVLSFCNNAPITRRLHPDMPPPVAMLDHLVEMTFQFTMGGIERAKALAPAPHPDTTP